MYRMPKVFSRNFYRSKRFILYIFLSYTLITIYIWDAGGSVRIGEIVNDFLCDKTEIVFVNLETLLPAKNLSDSYRSPGQSQCCGYINDRIQSKINSTCNLETSARGIGQKVISYSLFNKGTTFAQVRFFNAIEFNLILAENVYPGWRVRIYTNLPINSPLICKLKCKYDFLDWCFIDNIPNYGNLSEMNERTWRFLVVGDPTVELFISRDMDSPLSSREAGAVFEWEMMNSKAFHLIRDAQHHGKTEMLAGMWGMKNSLLSPAEGIKLRNEIIEFSKRERYKGLDQIITSQLIYKPYKDQVLAHDGYFCGYFPDSIVLPLPNQRIGKLFIGAIVKWNESGYTFNPCSLKSCPMKCRPKYGKHWSYC